MKIDADCGRGFNLIGDTCVNISYTPGPFPDIATNCEDIHGLGVGQITTTSKHFYYMLAVCNS